MSYGSDVSFMEMLALVGGLVLFLSLLYNALLIFTKDPEAREKNRAEYRGYLGFVGGLSVYFFIMWVIVTIGGKLLEPYGNFEVPGYITLLPVFLFFLVLGVLIIRKRKQQGGKRR
jgi:cytochrome bd-type quinol oxidase subunit 2